jgi:hypothetical protein
MALTNSQGTRLFFAPLGTAVATADDVNTAIGSAAEVGCIQDLGSLSTSRNVQTYSCLDTDDISKAFGSVSYGNFTVGMLFDSADAAGQAELKAMFASNTNRIAIIVLNDGVYNSTNGTNPTYFTFEAGVSNQDISIQKDNAVMITSTVEIASSIVEIPKA